MTINKDSYSMYVNPLLANTEEDRAELFKLYNKSQNQPANTELPVHVQIRVSVMATKALTYSPPAPASTPPALKTSVGPRGQVPATLISQTFTPPTSCSLRDPTYCSPSALPPSAYSPSASASSGPAAPTPYQKYNNKHEYPETAETRANAKRIIAKRISDLMTQNPQYRHDEVIAYMEFLAKAHGRVSVFPSEVLWQKTGKQEPGSAEQQVRDFVENVPNMMKIILENHKPENDIICFPMHTGGAEGGHWTLAYVDLKEGVIWHLDSMAGSSDKGPFRKGLKDAAAILGSRFGKQFVFQSGIVVHQRLQHDGFACGSWVLNLMRDLLELRESAPQMRVSKAIALVVTTIKSDCETHGENAHVQKFRKDSEHERARLKFYIERDLPQANIDVRDCEYRLHGARRRLATFIEQQGAGKQPNLPDESWPEKIANEQARIRQLEKDLEEARRRAGITG